jgi:hypothetical protein
VFAGFNPHPANRPGDAKPKILIAPGFTNRFNPHPANRPGDACFRTSKRRGSFNPHPNRSGDAQFQAFLKRTIVSIHTRPIGRVMPPNGKRLMLHVSIHTRPIGRVISA